jgi:hypothetical protein
MYRNTEGYSDPTAGKAVGNMMREYKDEQKKKWRRQYEIKNRPKVYVASKYAGDIDANVAAAVDYCKYVISQNMIPVASHLLYPQMLDDNNSNERELGLMFGLSLLAICDEVWCFGDVSASVGVQQELVEAKKLGKKIRYLKEGF